MACQIVIKLGLLFSLNALFTVLAPPPLTLVYRFDRRH